MGQILHGSVCTTEAVCRATGKMRATLEAIDVLEDGSFCLPSWSLNRCGFVGGSNF